MGTKIRKTMSAISIQSKENPNRKISAINAASMPQAPSPLDSANPVITLSPPKAQHERKRGKDTKQHAAGEYGTLQGVPDDAEIGHRYGGNGLLFLGEARHKERQQ